MEQNINSSLSLHNSERLRKLESMVQVYKEILEECFQIQISSIKFLGGGSYCVFEVNNDLIFRFSHENKSGTLRREKDLCESLRGGLSILIPYYLYFSDGCPMFKGAFGGYKKLEGTPLEHLCHFEKKRTAHQIGSFLSELHALEDPSNNDFSHEKARAELMQFYHQIQEKAFPILNEKERMD